MNFIEGNIYHLSGEGFAESALMNNNNLFTFYHTDDHGDWVFRGTKTSVVQWATQDMLDSGEIAIKPFRPAHSKRKKGPSRKAPSVNKATILFMSGETYTVKDFVSIEATAEKVVFIMEDNWKDTVNYRQAITVPNDDVVEVKVRGINHQFLLDMSLTNNGYLVWQQEGMEIILSELTVRV